MRIVALIILSRPFGLISLVECSKIQAIALREAGLLLVAKPRIELGTEPYESFVIAVSPYRCLCSRMESNQAPTDYESVALTE